MKTETTGRWHKADDQLKAAVHNRRLRRILGALIMLVSIPSSMRYYANRDPKVFAYVAGTVAILLCLYPLLKFKKRKMPKEPTAA